MSLLRVVGVAPGNQILNLKACLADDRVNLLSVFEPDERNLERIVSLPMDALCVYADDLDDVIVNFLDRVYMSRGRIGIFLLSACVDARMLSQAMAIGITEVVDVNVGHEGVCDQICAGVERLRTRREHVHVRERDSKVVCLYGTKGGCGKTSLAVNLAVCMQKADKRCAVIDLDLQFGDAADLFDIPRFDTIADLANEKVLNAESITPYLYHTDIGVDVLCAPHSPELAELVKPQMVERIVTALRCEYDFIVFDLAPALDDCSLAAMEISDTVYFVVNPEVPAIRNARTCLEILGTLGLKDKARLVVNKAGRSLVGPKDVEGALHMKSEAVIACDAKSSSLAINRGVPVVNCAARSKMSRDIRSFAKKVMAS